MASTRVDDSILRASEACCALFVARGTTQLTVAEITAEIGISARSFHRYFPIKAECVMPVFDWTTATFNEHVGSASGASVHEVLVTGFARMLGGDVSERTRTLFPLVFRDEEMWSVFLRAVHVGESSLAPVLAARLGVTPDSREGRVAAAAVATATRLALEEMVERGADPEQSFAAQLTLFGAGIPGL